MHHFWKKALLWLGTCVLISFCHSASLQAQTSDPTLSFTERPEDQLLILGLSVEKRLLDQGMLAYLDDQGLWLPLGYFSEKLEFPITVDSGSGRADGWFISEERTLQIDLQAGTIFVENAPVKMDLSLVEAHSDDLYLHADAIEKLFPLKLDLDLNLLLLKVTPEKTIPFQEREARNKKYLSLIEQNKKARKRPQIPKKELPYRMFSMPSFMGQFSTNYSRDSGADRYSNTMSLQGAGDLLKSESYYNFSAKKLKDEELEINRFDMTLKRQFDSDSAPISLLEKAEMTAGDVRLPSAGLLVGQTRARGVTLSRKRSNNAFFYEDKEGYRLEGPAPVGWDVELYQNKQFKDFQKIDDEGRYRFRELKLRNGLNIFKILLLGPNGEKEEIVQRLYRGSGMIAPGELRYQLGVGQKDQPLLPVTDQDDPNDPVTLSAMGEVGLTHHTSLGFGFYNGADDDDEGKVVILPWSLRSGYDRVFSRLDVAHTSKDQHAVSGQISTRLGKASLDLEHENYFGFTRDQERKSQASSISYFHTLPLISEQGIGFSLSGERTSYKDQSENDYQVKNELSHRHGKVSTKNELRFRFSRPSTGKTDVSGRFSLAGFEALKTRLTSDLDYAIAPVGETRSLNLSAMTKIDKERTFRTTVSQTLSGSEQTDITGEYNFFAGPVGLAISAGGNSSGTKRVGLNLRIGASPGKKAGSYISDKKIASVFGSTLQLRLFRDIDNDTVFSNGDEVLPDLQVKILQTGDIQTSDKNGLVTFTGLSSGMQATLEVVSNSIPDIYLKPSLLKFSVTPRAGSGEIVDLAFHQQGEIDGFLYESGDIPALNKRIKAKNTATQDSFTAHSAFDGYFLFSDIPVGPYELSVDGRLLGTLRLTPADNLALDVALSLQSTPDIAPPVSASETRAEPVAPQPQKVIQKQALPEIIHIKTPRRTQPAPLTLAPLTRQTHSPNRPAVTLKSTGYFQEIAPGLHIGCKGVSEWHQEGGKISCRQKIFH